MAPIEVVFMLSIDSKVNYENLQKICAMGHNKVLVYGEAEVPTSGVVKRNRAGSAVVALPSSDGKVMVKRIIRIFLVEQVGDLIELVLSRTIGCP